MSSTRLPGKVLAPLLGRPLLARQIERIRRARLDALCVATSSDGSDQPIADCCGELGVGCYRGSLSDVLDRYYQAARAYAPRHVVRITGDCPLVDPRLLDGVVDQHLREDNDYTSNAHVRSFPDGLDVEVFRFPALERAWRLATLPFEREHVTPWFYRSASTCRCGVYRDSVDRSAQRWVVDYPEDLEFVRAVYAALYPHKPDFGREDVQRLLDSRPELAALNARQA
ncbi:MAG: glycosyltransferase family protein [Gammaproteobacteria bacterium]|nr:glycosyltransferase family protein [Gammaproteobacteria bacterium]